MRCPRAWDLPSDHGQRLSRRHSRNRRGRVVAYVSGHDEVGAAGARGGHLHSVLEIIHGERGREAEGLGIGGGHGHKGCEFPDEGSSVYRAPLRSNQITEV